MPIQQGRVLEKIVNRTTNIFDLGFCDRIQKDVFQLCQPAKVLLPVIASIGIDMIDYIPLGVSIRLRTTIQAAGE